MAAKHSGCHLPPGHHISVQSWRLRGRRPGEVGEAPGEGSLQETVPSGGVLFAQTEER